VLDRLAEPNKVRSVGGAKVKANFCAFRAPNIDTLQTPKELLSGGEHNRI